MTLMEAHVRKLFFLKIVPPVQPFMGPVRLEKNLVTSVVLLLGNAANALCI